jgi:glucose-1-phosphate thymidylyltransferase
MSLQVRKGIVLAGGAGSRLYPVTQVACKQLLPVYDKPMIYYPLSTLMLFGIQEILLISTPVDTPRFQALLGTGEQFGLRLSYEVQPKPAGIAQALLIGESFANGDPLALILGDNIFFGVYDFLRQARTFEGGATVFGYYVSDPERYGVLGFDDRGKVTSIEEKPKAPKSHYAVTGLYLYDGGAAQMTRGLAPSARGELEITDLNRAYLEKGQLNVVRLGRGIAWLDTGTHESLLDAGNFIATVEKRQGQKVACLEEIAFRMGFLSRDQLLKAAERVKGSGYGEYLLGVVRESDGHTW